MSEEHEEIQNVLESVRGTLDSPHSPILPVVGVVSTSTTFNNSFDTEIDLMQKLLPDSFATSRMGSNFTSPAFHKSSMDQKLTMLGNAPINDFLLFATSLSTPVQTVPDSNAFERSLFSVFDSPSPIKRSTSVEDSPFSALRTPEKKPIGAERKDRIREASISENPTFHELEVLIGENLDLTEDLHSRTTTEESAWNPLEITALDQHLHSLPETIVSSNFASPSKFKSLNVDEVWDPLVAIPSSMSVPFEVELPESERRRLASVSWLRRLESPQKERRRTESAPWSRELEQPFPPLEGSREGQPWVPPVPRGPDIKNKKSELYKTELCSGYLASGYVRFSSTFFPEPLFLSEKSGIS
jgi:hypothetical protein